MTTIQSHSLRAEYAGIREFRDILLFLFRTLTRFTTDLYRSSSCFLFPHHHERNRAIMWNTTTRTWRGKHRKYVKEKFFNQMKIFRWSQEELAWKKWFCRAQADKDQTAEEKQHFLILKRMQPVVFYAVFSAISTWLTQYLNKAVHWEEGKKLFNRLPT